MTSSQWLVVLAAIPLTVVLCLLLVPLARKLGLVDHPGHRKVHETVTPLTGGIAIFATLALAMLWLMPDDRFMQGLMLGCSLMFLIGMVDDRRHIAPIVRFLVQIAACLVVVMWADVRLDDFGRLLTNDVLELGPLRSAITIFAAMGVINAFNMIDGMDGLAGSVFLVAAAGMALFAGAAGQVMLHGFLLLVMAAVLGFMLLNARFPWNDKARIFLGDSGSMLLGFVLAWCFVALGNDHNETGERAFMPMTAVWLFAVPLLDTTTQIWRRWRAGESALAADQYHLHHAFLRAGFSVGATWFNISLMALVLGGLGMLLDTLPVPAYLGFWLFLALSFAFYFYMRRSWRIQRFLGRDFIYNDFDEVQDL